MKYTYMLHEHGETYIILYDDTFVNPQELCTHLNAIEDSLAKERQEVMDRVISENEEA